MCVYNHEQGEGGKCVCENIDTVVAVSRSVHSTTILRETLESLVVQLRRLEQLRCDKEN
jgi:hypothetical protein